MSLIAKSTTGQKPSLPMGLEYAEAGSAGSWTWITCYNFFGAVSLCVRRSP